MTLNFEYLFYLYIGTSVLLVLGGLVMFLIRKIKKRRELMFSLDFVLFEVTLPQTGKEQDKKSFKDLVSSMEQFYAGLASILEDRWFGYSSFALELALPSVGEETAFFVAMPRKKARLFEKHLQGLYPSARVEEKKEDYNIFNPSGATSGGYFVLN